MVHGDQRNAETVADPLSAGDADEERADQARSRRHRDRLHVRPLCTRVAERTVHERKEMLQMLARGDLRYDAAERLVPLDLRGDEVHAHAAVVAEERDRGLVAGSLDPENHLRAETRGTLCHSERSEESPAAGDPSLRS